MCCVHAGRLLAIPLAVRYTAKTLLLWSLAASLAVALFSAAAAVTLAAVMTASLLFGFCL